MNNKRIILIVIVVIFIVTMGYMYWRKPIDISYSAIRYTIGDEEFDQVDIQMNGVFYYSLLRENRLRYELFIDGDRIPFSEEGKLVVPGRLRGRSFTEEDIQSEQNPMMDGYIHKENHSGAIYYTVDISYPYLENHDMKRFNFGTLYFSKGFEDLIISICKVDGNKASWKSTEGYEIIVTKSDIESAEQFARELMNMSITVD